MQIAEDVPAAVPALQRSRPPLASRTRCKAPALLALTLALSGCGGLHVYSEQNLKAAQTAQQTFAATPLTDVISTQRVNSAALTTEEVQLQRDIVTTRRDLLLFVIASDGSCDPSKRAPGDPMNGPSLPDEGRSFSATMRGCIDRRVEELYGSPVDMNARTLQDEADTLRHALPLQEDAVAQAAVILFADVGVHPPACSLEKAPTPDEKSQLRAKVEKSNPDKLLDFDTLYGIWESQCAAKQELMHEALAAFKGDVGQAARDYTTNAAELAELRVYAATMKQQADAAAAEYAAALAAEAEATADAAKTKKNLDGAADKLHKALDGLAEAGGPLGISMAAKTRIASIDTIITAITKGDSLDPAQYSSDVREAVAVLAVTPALAEEAAQLVHQQQAPPISPLLLQKELDQIRAASADRQVALQQGRVDLYWQRFATMVDEFLELMLARQSLGWARKSAGCEPHGRCPPLDAAATTVFGGDMKPQTKVYCFEAVEHYAASMSINQARERELAQLVVATEYEMALDHSEDAVRTWQALIAAPIDQLLAYHASGIKPDTIVSAAAQLLGMGAIAVGVNR